MRSHMSAGGASVTTERDAVSLEVVGEVVGAEEGELVPVVVLAQPARNREPARQAATINFIGSRFSIGAVRRTLRLPRLARRGRRARGPLGGQWLRGCEERD